MAYEILSDKTRKTRKALLAASLIGICISHIDVNISKVTVFGTEFKFGNFEAIPIILGLIILFYLINFYAYGALDLRNFQKMYSREAVDTIIKDENNEPKRSRKTNE